MSRHRKIEVKMWGDAKFCSLSAPQPCAQFLWIYLLSGPHTTNLPGLSHIGEAALAENLGWDLKDFRIAFLELSDRGMVEADWKRRIVFVPKALSYNMPQSPKVVVSWQHHWDELPECDLKRKAQLSFKDQFKDYGKGYQEALRVVFGEAKVKVEKPTSTGAIGIQEQEQEQEQEQDNTPLTPQRGNRGRAVDGYDPLFDDFWNAYPLHVAEKEARRIWDELNVTEAMLGEMLRSIAAWKKTDQWRRKKILRPDRWLAGAHWNDVPPDGESELGETLEQKLQRLERERLARSPPEGSHPIGHVLNAISPKERKGTLDDKSDKP